jgi:hypothetical protein
MYHASTVDIGEGLDGLSKQSLSKRERNSIVLRVEEVLEAAVAGFSEQ